MNLDVMNLVNVVPASTAVSTSNTVSASNVAPTNNAIANSSVSLNDSKSVGNTAYNVPNSNSKPLSKNFNDYMSSKSDNNGIKDDINELKHLLNEKSSDGKEIEKIKKLAEKIEKELRDGKKAEADELLDSKIAKELLAYMTYLNNSKAVDDQSAVSSSNKQLKDLLDKLSKSSDNKVTTLMDKLKSDLQGMSSENDRKSIENVVSDLKDLLSGDNLTSKSDILATVDRALSEAKNSVKDGKTSMKLSEAVKNIGDLIDKLSSDELDKASNAKEVIASSLAALKSESYKGKDSSSSNENYRSDRDNDILKQIAAGNDTKDKATNLVELLQKFSPNNTVSNTELSAEKLIINKNTMVNDIVSSIKYMQKGDLQDLTIKINPKELGEVIIKLTMQDGVMKANITATNKEAYNLLNSNLQDISSKLNNPDIGIQNFTVDIYNGDTTFFSGESSKENQNQGSSQSKIKNISGDETIDEDTAEDEHDGSVNILA